MKRTLLLASSLLALTAVVPMARYALTGTPARAQDCTNFWINPNTGQEECLRPGTRLQTTPATPTPRSGPALQFYNVEAGQSFFTGEIHNVSSAQFKGTAIRYRMERRGDVLAEGVLVGQELALAPGEPTTFRWQFSNRLKDTPRGNGVRLVLTVDDTEIELKPRYNFRLN